MDRTIPEGAIGVGLRTCHQEKFLKESPKSVAWLEVISENYMNWRYLENTSKLRALRKLREHYPISLHGVSLSIGSTDPLNMEYLMALKDLIKDIEPCSVSDHLCWTGVAGNTSYDLLPLPFTTEAVRWLTERIDFVQNYLGQKIMLENISSYLEFSGAEMAEAEFLNEVISRSGCDLLLDVNNVYVNSNNFTFDPFNYIKALPLKRVGHIHLAGHSKGNNGLLIDTHGTSVSDAVWNLYQTTCHLMGRHKVMIERDENIPEWEELEVELLKLRSIHEEFYGRCTTEGPATGF